MNGKGMKAIPILVMLALMVGAYAPAAFAATDFTLDWSGFGTVTGTFNSGDDAVAYMKVMGNTAGTFYALDTDVEPYSYGVDNTEAYMRGDITGGGQLEFKYTRTDSYEAGYGVSGQWSDSFVYSCGLGSIDFRTSSNYANLVSSEYGFQPNGQFTAIGDDFLISHVLHSGDPDNWGALTLTGAFGSAVVDYMADGYTGGDGFRFGSGDGCYTNADILATGSGTAQVQGQGDSYLTSYDGSWTLASGGYHSEGWSYISGLSVTNFAFYGN